MLKALRLQDNAILCRKPNASPSRKAVFLNPSFGRHPDFECKSLRILRDFVFPRRIFVYRRNSLLGFSLISI